jgi:hypothetical protein
MKKISLIISFQFCFILLVTASSWAFPFIHGPYKNVRNNDIIVSLAVGNPEELEAAIRSGVEKEIIYTIELLRVWNFWPDEFIVSKRVIRTVKYDNLREHYRIISMDGMSRSETIIKADSRSLKKSIFTVKAVNLVNIKELLPGMYYIRAIIETKSIEQFPLIGFIMHFIPESEITLAEESEPFLVEASFEKP